jgi:hypothetical protein
MPATALWKTPVRSGHFGRATAAMTAITTTTNAIRIAR